MYFMGKPVLMDNLRTMVASMMVEAEDLLWGQLMFEEGDDEHFVVPLVSIEDDLTQTRRGRSFVHSNGLAGKEVEMLKGLVAGVRKYLKLVRKFEEFLLLLAHITGGQPSRREEITGLRLVTGINRDHSPTYSDIQSKRGGQIKFRTNIIRLSLKLVEITSFGLYEPEGL
ncbi:recq helicase [Fusarium langsethiae]|uniref:Recq helicase n=1 Tax=Fusarium langsethiae TaxID=179993 RepID=A0A0M9ETU6_FUSLA|nr:recq helicase [Fusarium langsethiae]